MDIEINGKPVEVDRRRHMTVQDLLGNLGLIDDDALKVQINQEDVPKSAWQKHGVHPEDQVQISRSTS